jgi:hypothetical protein
MYNRVAKLSYTTHEKVRFENSENMEHTAGTVTLYTCIRTVPGSNLSRTTPYYNVRSCAAGATLAPQDIGSRSDVQ